LPVRDIVGIAIGTPLIIGLIVAIVFLVIKFKRMSSGSVPGLREQLLTPPPEDTGTFAPLVSGTE
jgi:hypothetical protein